MSELSRISRFILCLLFIFTFALNLDAKTIHWGFGYTFGMMMPEFRSSSFIKGEGWQMPGMLYLEYMLDFLGERLKCRAGFEVDVGSASFGEFGSEKIVQIPALVKWEFLHRSDFALYSGIGFAFYEKGWYPFPIFSSGVKITPDSKEQYFFDIKLFGSSYLLSLGWTKNW